MSDEYVIYQCSCGNFVAEPTVEAARARLDPNVELRGAVICTAPKHGVHQPEMRRTVVVEA